jgi:hypothetical protein
LDNGFKKVVEVKFEGEKKYRITNIFKVDRIKLSRSVAERKVRIKRERLKPTKYY